MPGTLGFDVSYISQTKTLHRTVDPFHYQPQDCFRRSLLEYPIEVFSI